MPGYPVIENMSSINRRTVVLILVITSSFVLIAFYNLLVFPNQDTSLIRTVTNCDWEPSKSFVLDCDCDRTRRVPRRLNNFTENSSCDDYSTSRGAHQKVVSFTLFGKPFARTSSIYFRGLELAINGTALRYPGWVMRFYHNMNTSDQRELDRLCPLWCQNGHVDFCDVRRLPPPLCDQSKVYGAHWRFFPLGDPLVDRFISRDLDSPIIQREVDAVGDWIRKNKTFHLMRDHPHHKLEVMAGMWGATNKDLTLTVSLRDKFISNGLEWKSGLDQTLLTQIVWPVAVNDSVSHSSYWCENYPNNIPFPTMRDNATYVGMIYPWRITYLLKTKCPQKCRPAQHQDWEYC